GAGRAVEVEIVEADIVEEAEALVDLLEDGAGDLLLLRAELLLEGGEPLQGVADGAAGGHGDVFPGDLDRERLGAEAGAVAGLAGGGALIFGELLAHPGGFGLEHAAVQIADHAFEGLADVVALAAVDEGEGDRTPLGAVEDDVVDFVRQVVPRRVEAEAELAGEGAEDLHIIRAGRVGLGPGHDGALLDRQILVGDDELRVEEELFAETVAGGAGALGGVEAE